MKEDTELNIQKRKKGKKLTEEELKKESDITEHRRPLEDVLRQYGTSAETVYFHLLFHLFLLSRLFLLSHLISRTLNATHNVPLILFTSKGLTNDEAAARYQQYGPNALTPQKVIPLWLLVSLIHFFLFIYLFIFMSLVSYPFYFY